MPREQEDEEEEEDRQENERNTSTSPCRGIEQTVVDFSFIADEYACISWMSQERRFLYNVAQSH